VPGLDDRAADVAGAADILEKALLDVKKRERSAVI